MRTIKFRGKASHNGEWLFGYLINICGNYHILGKDDMREDGHHVAQDSDRPTWVDPETVGQFTGLHDKNGKEIYEGDIVRYRPNNKVYQAVFKDGIFWGEGENGCGCAAHFFPACEIVGNVFDNPELIEKGGEL